MILRAVKLLVVKEKMFFFSIWLVTCQFMFPLSSILKIWNTLVYYLNVAFTPLKSRVDVSTKPIFIRSLFSFLILKKLKKIIHSKEICFYSKAQIEKRHSNVTANHFSIFKYTKTWYSNKKFEHSKQWCGNGNHAFLFCFLEFFQICKRIFKITHNRLLCSIKMKLLLMVSFHGYKISNFC